MTQLASDNSKRSVPLPAVPVSVETREADTPARHEGCPGTCSAFCHQQDQVACVAVAQHRAVRWWLMGVGVLSVGLGALGVIVPGLPTTVFLIIASWCFVRSCPALERVLIRNRFFAPFVKYLRPGVVMPTKARVWSTAAIWIASLASSWVLAERHVPAFVIAIVLLSAAVGTFFVWRVARGNAEHPTHAAATEA